MGKVTSSAELKTSQMLENAFWQSLSPIWHGLFLNRQLWGAMRAPHHNFVVIAPMTMQFGTDVKLDVFYTMVPKKFVTSLLLRHYDVITCILANA